MTTVINEEELKKTIIRLLNTDPELRVTIRNCIEDKFATKDEIVAVLDELKQLRIDTNKRIDQVNERIDQVNERIDQLNKRIDQVERRLEILEKRVDQLDIKITALGSRWGIFNERAVRNALRGLFEEKFGVKVTKWEYFDKEGIVFHAPSVIEVDVVISNSKHTLIEIKSSISKGDVAELLRIAEVYERENNVKPELAIITPFIDEKALEFAKMKGIKVYSEREL